MAGLPGLQQTRSLSRSGLSQVTVIFKDGTDIFFARQLINERLQVAKEQLPEGVEAVMGPVSTGLGEIFLWTVEAEDGAVKEDGTPYTPTDLRVIQTGSSSLSCVTSRVWPRSIPSAVMPSSSRLRRIQSAWLPTS